MSKTPLKRIDASPTKEFFLHMLTRDIDLYRAIADLVDNCVDAAYRLRRNKKKDKYKNLWVRISISQNHFRIEDNCGGIPVDVARKYAFRFGRTRDCPVQSLIGQFGVGMKRALFKMGQTFEITSKTESSFFSMKENTDDWLTNKDSEWEFKFDTLTEGKVPSSKKALESGTTIEITDLFEGVAETFKLKNFENELREDLAAAHQKSLEEGLQIILQGIPIQFSPAELLFSDDLKPAVKDREIESSKGTLRVNLFAGLHKSSPKNAGWNIYCNGRLVLEADKTSLTGWGEENPNYHNEYARFRGYAFFDSDTPEMVPWNTTKSGVDAESAHFRAIRLDMIQLMRPVINYLIKVASQKKKSKTDRYTPLEKQIRHAKSTPLSKLSKRKNETSFFEAKEIEEDDDEDENVTIHFSRPWEQVQEVKSALRVRSNTKVGEKVFDYFYEMEIE